MALLYITREIKALCSLLLCYDDCNHWLVKNFFIDGPITLKKENQTFARILMATTWLY